MGNDPVNLFDPNGGCVDGNGNVIPCPDGAQDGLNGFHTTVLDGFEFNGGGMIGDQSILTSKTTSNASSNCHSCSNSQLIRPTYSVTSDVINAASLIYSLYAIGKNTSPVKMATTALAASSLINDAGVKTTKQEQVDQMINIGATVISLVAAPTAPIAAYIGMASNNKETINEMTQNITEGYHSNYKRTQETTNRHLLIQQEMHSRYRETQKNNGN